LYITQKISFVFWALIHGQRASITWFFGLASRIEARNPCAIFLFLMNLFSSKIDNGPWSEPSLALARFRSNSYQLNKNGLSCLKKGPLKPKKAFWEKIFSKYF